jgi:DNA-binding MarR family transcriptional regulator
LFKSLSLKYPDAGTYTPEIANELPLIVYATSLATQLDLLLQAENTAKGHVPLKRSYWQVLEKINQQGVRINDLAELNGISKQAISQLANEIERSGYITRVDDPSDKRAKNLLLTKKGEQLILDTLASTEKVETLIKQNIGYQAMQELKQCFQHYLMPESGCDQQNTEETTEEKMHKLLGQFFQSMEEKEKPKWLEEKNGVLLLTDYALKIMRTMPF